MKDDRLNIRLEAKLAQQIKSYAKKHHVTVSAIIEKHLRELIEQEKQQKNPPVYDAEQI